VDIRFFDSLDVKGFRMEVASPVPNIDQGIAPTRARYRLTHTTKSMKWQKDDDELLMRIMSQSERPNYASLAQLFPGKTGQQVAERWDKVLNPALTKGSWTRAEDEVIIEFVRAHGTKKWQKLSDLLPGRIGKQCRERWRNHLDPAINHAPWTPDEDRQLVEFHRQFGNAWVKIAGLMRNRSDNAVKNRWNATLRKTEVAAIEETADQMQTPPPSSPFVTLQATLGLISPVIGTARGGQGATADWRSLEENRRELLRLMLD
jgi:hypothetical protein